MWTKLITTQKINTRLSILGVNRRNYHRCTAHHMLKDYFEQRECLKPNTSHGISVNKFQKEPTQNPNTQITHIYSTIDWWPGKLIPAHA